MRNHFNMLTSSNDFFVKIRTTRFFYVLFVCCFMRDFHYPHNKNGRAWVYILLMGSQERWMQLPFGIASTPADRS